jgi:broad-specificity NMP kinase
MGGGGDICEVCQENIRAEAMGRQKKIARETSPKATQLRIRGRKVAKGKTSLLQTQSGQDEKKPRDFKSMAEYLDYLKKKKQ